jgi:hypothetical protein
MEAPPAKVLLALISGLIIEGRKSNGHADNPFDTQGGTSTGIVNDTNSVPLEKSKAIDFPLENNLECSKVDQKCYQILREVATSS